MLVQQIIWATSFPSGFSDSCIETKDIFCNRALPLASARTYEWSY